MKILITGATGKVGTKIINAISSANEIIAVDRNMADLGSKVKFYQADLTNVEEIEKIFQTEKPNQILHLAAILGPACENDPVLAHKINVEASENLAKLASKYNVQRFIFASTSAVYKQDQPLPTNEDENINPQSVYGKTKLEAEQKIREILTASATKLIILRMFNIYGQEFSESVIQKLIFSTSASPVIITGPDNFIRDYVHITDVVKAFELAVYVKIESQIEIINIASGIAISNTQLIKVIKAKYPNIQYTIQPCSNNFSWANIDKAKMLLNFSPHLEILLI